MKIKTNKMGWKNKRRYNKLKRCYYGVKGCGIKGFISYMKDKPRIQDNSAYMEWITRFKFDLNELERQKNEEFVQKPLISILVPVYNTKPDFFEDMIESVRKQTYGNWELCIANASPSNKVLSEILEKKNDSRIKVIDVVNNEGIAQNTNAALEIATGDYIGLLDHDDTLAENALFEIVKLVNQRNADVIYTDEDKMSWDGKEYFEPHFKSDMNQDLLYSNNYICHFFVVKRKIAKEIGGFREKYNGAQDYDFILRCTNRTKKVEHIAKPLYHWRSHKDSTAENPESKQYAYEAGKRAIEDLLQENGKEAIVEDTENPGFYHVKYKLKNNDKVLIIVIYQDRDSEKRQIKKCIRSIKKTAGYSNYEIVFMQKNSKIVPTELKAKYLMFVDSTIEVISKGWLYEMLAIIQQEYVGAVGAKIYKRNETIYHAGIILGKDTYAFENQPRWEYAEFHRDSLMQDMSAVSSDMMIISREDFLGITDGDLQKLNDEGKIGKKIYAKGKKVVYNPNIEAYTMKSKSCLIKSEDADMYYESLKKYLSELRY